MRFVDSPLHRGDRNLKTQSRQVQSLLSIIPSVVSRTTEHLTTMANTAAGVAVQVLRSSRYPRWRASIRDLSTSPCRRTAEEPQAESSRAAAQAARARAWYLDDDDVAQQTSQPVRRPRFTTFDPMSTTDSAVPRLVRPFPNDAPAYLRSVWDFLMGDEAAEALDAGTVTLIRTRDQTARPRLDGDQIRGVEEVGPVWRWIIVAEVIGNARGVVARADGLLRRWVSIAANEHR